MDMDMDMDVMDMDIHMDMAAAIQANMNVINKVKVIRVKAIRIKAIRVKAIRVNRADNSINSQVSEVHPLTPKHSPRISIKEA